MKIEKMLFGALLVCLPSVAAAQQSGDSSRTSQTEQTSQSQSSNKKQDDVVASAARRAREQKKDQPKTTKVWDNDNIPSKPDAITILDEQNSAGSGADQSAPAAPRTTQDSKAVEAKTKESEAISKELASAKEELQSLNKDLDLLSRKYTLDQQDYYGKTDYASDTQGAAKMRDEQDQIDAKKQAIADVQKKVDDLTQKLSETASDSGKAPTNPQ